MHREVLDSAVVPHDHRSRFPGGAALERGVVSDVIEQHAENGFTFVLGHVSNFFCESFVYEQHRAS